MKITKRQLRRVISEELSRLREGARGTIAWPSGDGEPLTRDDVNARLAEVRAGLEALGFVTKDMDSQSGTFYAELPYDSIAMVSSLGEDGNGLEGFAIGYAPG